MMTAMGSDWDDGDQDHKGDGDDDEGCSGDDAGDTEGSASDDSSTSDDDEPGAAADNEDATPERARVPYNLRHRRRAPVDPAQRALDVEMNERYGERTGQYHLRRRRRPRGHAHAHVLKLERFADMEMTFVMQAKMLLSEKGDQSTEQMNLKKGLSVFGDDGREAVKKEMKQLHDRETIEPCDAARLSSEQKRKALQYLMFLKRKRCGRIKGRGCADGRKQRIYKDKSETSSPTVKLESLMLSSTIDAFERRKVVTCDVPGAFMQTDIDEEIHVRLEGEMAELLASVDSKKKKLGCL